MANSSSRILKEIKSITFDMMDSNGNFRITPIGNIGKRKISNSRLDLIRKFLKAVYDSSILKDETKLYLKGVDTKYSTICELVNMNNKLEDKVSEAAIVGRIQYDKVKLEKAFGQSFIAELVYSTINQKQYEDKINQFILENDSSFYGNRDKLLIKFDTGVVSPEFDRSSGSFMDTYGHVIESFAKWKVDKLVESLNSNKEFVGYMNFLMSSIPTSSEEVSADREMLLHMLNEPKEELDTTVVGERIDINNL